MATGCTGLLGASFVKGISEAGGIPFIVGRNAQVAKERAWDIIKQGGNAIALVADVLNKDELLTAKKIIMEKFGRIDGLVNASGGNMPEGTVQPDNDIFNINIEGMRKVLDINLFGTLLPVQVFGQAIAKRWRQHCEPVLNELVASCYSGIRL